MNINTDSSDQVAEILEHAIKLARPKAEQVAETLYDYRDDLDSNHAVSAAGGFLLGASLVVSSMLVRKARFDGVTSQPRVRLQRVKKFPWMGSDGESEPVVVKPKASTSHHLASTVLGCGIGALAGFLVSQISIPNTTLTQVATEAVEEYLEAPQGEG